MPTRLSTPLGPMVAHFEGSALTGLRFATPNEAEHAHRPASEAEKRLLAQLERYFAGESTAFDIPLAPQGSAFACAVWCALQDIPFGTTCAYIDIATAVGQPRASRAVGRANGANPICIIIPCHRVVRSGGAIGGYGGGVDRKRALLNLERSVTAAATRAPTPSTAAAAA